MAKWNMIVDVARCENCHNCTLSVKDEHIGNDFPEYAAPQPSHGHEWIKISRKVRGSGHMVDAAYLPTMCNHCDNAPCLKAGSVDGSVRKRPDGIVIIDPQKAKGRRDLVDSCPYGAIWWNDELELPQIWIFDAHLLDRGWKEPRAASCCPTSALEAIKIDDAEMQSRVRDERLEVLKPELGTRPRIYYKNLHRFAKCFLGGTVTALIDSKTECVEGATITLAQGGNRIAETTSDVFGDFKFDGLEPKSEPYRVEIRHPFHGAAVVELVLNDSRNAGELQLSSI